MARGRPHKCPYCEATKSVAKGFRYNTAGKVRLRRCKSCGRRWTVGPVPADSGDAGVGAPSGETATDMTYSEESPPDDGVRGEQEQNENETQQETTDERRIELPLSGERSPSQDDSGRERERESEETFFTQREM